MPSSIIIVGGGITALSTAWFLSKAGFSVQVIYQRRSGTATQAAGGMLSPACEADGASPALISLGLQSCQLYPEWIQEIERLSGIDCQYRKEGTLLVAMHHDQYKDLEHLRQFQQRHGLDVQELSRREVREREPNLTRQVGGLFCPADHSVHPRSLWSSLHQALLHKGVQITDATTLSISTTDERFQEVIADGQRYQADGYILSDGAWTGELYSLPLRPVKGQYIRLQGENLIDRVVRTPNIYCIPRANGELFIGATMEEEGFNQSNTAGAVMDFLYHSFQILPAIYELDIQEIGSGFRPALRDNQPLIGASTMKNCWFNTAHYRHGILIAPAAAQLCSSILQGEKEPIDFSLHRFHDNKIQ